jgi:mono/diheme cytochrome c family protein
VLRIVYVVGVALAMLMTACTAQREETPPAAPPTTQAPIPEVELTFIRDQREMRRVSLRELSAHAKARVVESDDPYYGQRKRFRGLPLNDVLVFAFQADLSTLRAQSFVLRALDGYAVPVQGARLLEGGAYLAFDDLDVPGFAPIGPQRVSPAPTYLVWTQPGQNNLDTHPRPWQLSTIEIAPIETLYPHTPPSGVEQGNAAQHGYVVFVDHCIKCHAINREGGRVGPELNVPQSIVEYRPLTQIRAYIKNPATFRYGAMPAHPNLTEADLDNLIAYFTLKATQKHDPDAAKQP